MLKVVTAREMQGIDRLTIEEYGIAGTILMERAGLSVAEKINYLFFQNSEVKQRTTESGQRRTIAVLCGSGNNGGDGLVVARILHNNGHDVRVFITTNPEDLKADASINYKAVVKFGVKIYPIRRFLTHHASCITHHDIIVDAILGTGLSKDVREPLSTVIEKVNKLPSAVVSIDIPSGISSDNGQIMGCAIKADYTVTFGLPKRGHLLYPGAEHTGRLFVEDIGFPRRLLTSEDIKVNLVEEADAISLLPERPRYSHKGTYGHVLLIAGSRGKTGAGLMAARACLRTGAGLVTVGVPESLINAFQSRVTEEMTLPLPDKGNGTLSIKSYEPILDFLKRRANVLAIGPGISVDDEIRELMRILITQINIPMVIDADGLNAITGNTTILKKSRAPIILTPHPGEMARLLKDNSKFKVQNSKLMDKDLLQLVEQDRISAAISFAKKRNTYLILKGVPTITATPQGGAYINPTGNPGMAKAGIGDVLTGMVSAFLAQGLKPLNAAILGVYMHGRVADIVAKKKGEHSLVASDIINAIPRVFNAMKG